MTFPDTPVTLIELLHKKRDLPQLWEASWEDFFDTYHETVRVCAYGAFQRRNWYNVQEADIQDVVLRVFNSIYRGKEPFVLDSSKGRFRQFLTTIVNRRVADFILQQSKRSQEVSLETDNPEVGNHVAHQSEDKFRKQERHSYQNALLGTILTALRKQVSPEIYMVFELVKLNGESPEDVARQFNVTRGVIDNRIYKASKKLQEIIQQPEIQTEADGLFNF